MIASVAATSFLELTKDREFHAKASLSESSDICGVDASGLSTQFSQTGKLTWSFQDPISVSTVDRDYSEKAIPTD